MRTLRLVHCLAVLALPGAAAVSLPRRQPTRALQRSAAHFAGCRSGTPRSPDLDLNEFVDACREFCDMIRTFGVFVSPSVANVRLCLGKIEHACDELSRGDGPRRRWGRRKSLSYKSMKALLQAEAEAGVHGKGAVLADPSAAIGLLWVRRGLAFWSRVFEQEAEALGRRSADARTHKAKGALRRQSNAAYDELLSPVHGWVSRRAYGMAMSGCPEWSEVRRRAGLPDDDDELRADLLSWAKAMRRIEAIMKALQLKFGMEDARKSV